MNQRLVPSVVLFAGLLTALMLLFSAALLFGEAGSLSPGELSSGLLSLFGLADPPAQHAIFLLRLWRALVVLAVGASLALSGALLQGLFRNPLASPSLLGVSAGAGLGAMVALLLIADVGPETAVRAARSASYFLVPSFAFLGALGITTLVFLWMLRRGPTSIATLLLVGVALTSLCGAAVATIHSLVLDYGDVSRAIVEWGFGNFDDRGSEHVWMVWSCLGLAVIGLPFLRRELDLLALGEEDAQTLGVSPRRIKILVVLLSSLLAAGAVAVAGQIAFVGLIIPNLVRYAQGPMHARLLPASALSGAGLLLLIDTLQRVCIADLNLRPGVLMSLVGAPFFLLLLLKSRRELAAW